MSEGKPELSKYFFNTYVKVSDSIGSSYMSSKHIISIVKGLYEQARDFPVRSVTDVTDDQTNLMCIIRSTTTTFNLLTQSPIKNDTVAWDFSAADPLSAQ